MSLVGYIIDSRKYGRVDMQLHCFFSPQLLPEAIFSQIDGSKVGIQFRICVPIGSAVIKVAGRVEEG